MPYENVLTYDDLMQEALRQHRGGDYEAAISTAEQAYNGTEDPLEKGRAARDIGARYDRLGKIDDSKTWATTAYDMHKDAVAKGVEGARRECAVSELYVGVGGLRKLLHTGAFSRSNNSDEASEVLGHFNKSWADLQEAKKEPKTSGIQIDQYEINASRRVSMANTLLGNRRVGLSMAARAIGLAFWSESPRLATANKDLSLKERFQAKQKALLGGVAALGIGLINLPNISKTTKIAAKLTDKVL